MREHKMKITHGSLDALVKTLESFEEPVYPHGKIVDQMLEALCADLVVRFRQKLLIRQEKYSFKLKMHEALGLQYILSCCQYIGPYELNEVNKIAGTINQQYA